MKHLIVRNIGPLREVDINIESINLIIGLQSSGKSCVLKTACYCAWVEKRIELAQTAKEYENGTKFIDDLLSYYKMQSYLSENSYIEYVTPYLQFSYDHKNKKFSFKWKSQRWKYKRPKVSYIPSDRNLVAAIPAWSKLSLDYDNLLDFMGDWDIARKQTQAKENILDLGMGYFYDAKTNSDQIRLKNGHIIRLTESSSGVQSLVPLIIHLEYLNHDLYLNQDGLPQTFQSKEARKSLLSKLYNKVLREPSSSKDDFFVKSVDGVDFVFADSDQVNSFKNLAHNYLDYDHNEIFLEEPEDNLFPTTQCQLVNWLLDSVMGAGRKDTLFIATHSPYILNQLLKRRPKGMNLYFTHPVSAEGMFDVKSLSEEEFGEIYDDGVDLFFNVEAYV